MNLATILWRGLTFQKQLGKEEVLILESIVKQSASDEMNQVLNVMNAGDFFEYCKMGYVANDYVKAEIISLVRLSCTNGLQMGEMQGWKFNTHFTV